LAGISAMIEMEGCPLGAHCGDRVSLNGVLLPNANILGIEYRLGTGANPSSYCTTLYVGGGWQ